MTQIESGQPLPNGGLPAHVTMFSNGAEVMPPTRALPAPSSEADILSPETPLASRLGDAALALARGIPKVPKIMIQGHGPELVEALRRIS